MHMIIVLKVVRQWDIYRVCVWTFMPFWNLWPFKPVDQGHFNNTYVMYSLS
jgi:hypothetical protein